MIKIFTSCIILIFFVSCSTGTKTTFGHTKLIYQNIIILSDMSSRINNMPPKDIDEIHNLVNYFKDDCVKPGEKIGDKSSIYFSTFSDTITASIDISRYKTLIEKQSFINSIGKYSNSGLTQKIKDFEIRVKDVYNNIRNPGLDLISILVDKIDNKSIVKPNTFLTDGLDTTFINYDNHIYIFTDGYLEYQNKNLNNQFYFGNAEIEKVRKYCMDNNTDITKAIQNNRSLRLPISKSKQNEIVTLHVLETHERDFDRKFQTYKHPKGLRDNEILEMVWKTWAKESGFKNLEWKKY